MVQANGKKMLPNPNTLFMKETFLALIKILFETFQKLKRNGTKCFMIRNHSHKL